MRPPIEEKRAHATTYLELRSCVKLLCLGGFEDIEGSMDSSALSSMLSARRGSDERVSTEAAAITEVQTISQGTNRRHQQTDKTRISGKSRSSDHP